MASPATERSVLGASRLETDCPDRPAERRHVRRRAIGEAGPNRRGAARPGPRRNGPCHFFQLACLEQASVSTGCVFSQAVIDRVSVDDIFEFMQVQ